MKVIIALALAGAAAAAPLQSGKYVEGTPEGHRPGSYVPGSSIVVERDAAFGLSRDPVPPIRSFYVDENIRPILNNKREALQSGKYVKETPEGHRPGSYVPGSSIIKERDAAFGLTKDPVPPIRSFYVDENNRPILNNKREALQSGKSVEETPEGQTHEPHVPLDSSIKEREAQRFEGPWLFPGDELPPGVDA